MRPLSIRPTRALGLALLCAASSATAPAAASAQTLGESTATPDATAELFIRSLRALRWSAVAQFIDPETLVRFRDVVTMMTEVEPSGELLRYLTGTDPAAYAALAASEVFSRALTAMTSDMPGLSYAFADRDDEVLGHVWESAASAHVVYRTHARISGALPEVKVMQMRRGPSGWRVLWSDEMIVLETALRGASRLR